MDQAPRFLFGNYILLHRLGQGGMAELFLATRADAAPDDPPLVIKRMLPSMGENPEFCSMFLNEARLAAQLIHPNIVRVLDLGQVDDQLYVALEFIDGQDLSQLLTAHGRLSAPVAARVALGVCEALAYAHEAKDLQGNALDVVHRDVSPDNVMVTRHGGIKLIDFGIAKVLSHSGMTRPGIIKGKYGYIAPEYMRGLGLDGRADLFSLGALLYETITGAQPFERASAEETMARVLSFEPLPPKELVASCPQEFSDIVMRALQKSPEMRYVNARHMANELNLFLTICGEHVGAAELAALTWGPVAAAPAQPQPAEPETSEQPSLAARSEREPLVRSEAAIPQPSQPGAEAPADGPLTMPILGAVIPTRVDRPTRILDTTAKRNTTHRLAKGVGLGALLAGAALLGRLTANVGETKIAAARAGLDARAEAALEQNPGFDAAAVAEDAAAPADAGEAADAADAADRPDAAEPGPDVATPGADAATEEAVDAGAAKATTARTLLQIKGRGTVLVDGKACQAPCAIKVQPGSHVIERNTGKKRFKKTVQVAAGAPFVFNIP